LAEEVENMDKIVDANAIQPLMLVRRLRGPLRRRERRNAVCVGM
jgi:hypothetical protein